jgi:hypothetical protein
MRTGNKKLCLVLSLSAMITAIAPEGRAQGKLRGIVRVGGDFGGDKVAQFQYSDGSTPSVTAGRGLLVSGGGALELLGSADQALDLQASVGLKYQTIPPASNQNATWARFPVEGLLMYRTPFGLRVGGGAIVHLRNVLEASGATLNDRVEFKNTPGFLGQTEYGFGKWALDFRYTMMKYEASQSGTGTVSANSLGVGLSYAFGGSMAGSPKTR